MFATDTAYTVIKSCSDILSCVSPEPPGLIWLLMSFSVWTGFIWSSYLKANAADRPTWDCFLNCSSYQKHSSPQTLIWGRRVIRISKGSWHIMNVNWRSQQLLNSLLHPDTSSVSAMSATPHVPSLLNKQLCVIMCFTCSVSMPPLVEKLKVTACQTLYIGGLKLLCPPKHSRLGSRVTEGTLMDGW